MKEPSTPREAWQYALVWTPGVPHSQCQLWATTRHGHRTLWDSWEVSGFEQTPTLSGVLYWLYFAAVELQERHAHLG